MEFGFIFVFFVGIFALILFLSHQLQTKDIESMNQAVTSVQILSEYLKKMPDSELERKLKEIEPLYERLLKKAYELYISSIEGTIGRHTQLPMIFTGFIRSLPPNEYSKVLEYQEIFRILQDRKVISRNSTSTLDYYESLIENYYHKNIPKDYWSNSRYYGWRNHYHLLFVNAAYTVL